MKNWEEAYNNFDETRFEELRAKIDSRKYTREEMVEFRKISKIKNNLPLLNNLMNYKNNLQVKLKELKELKAEYEKKANYDEQKEKLEKEMTKYSNRQQIINARQKEIKHCLNNLELSDSVRKQLEKEQKELKTESAEIRNKVDNNNAFFRQNEKNIIAQEKFKNKPNNKKFSHFYTIVAQICLILNYLKS